MSSSDDVDKLRRELERLQRDNARLQMMVEASLEALVFHRQGRVVDVNPAFTRIFGYSRDEARDMDVTLLAAPEYRQRVAEAVRSGREQPYEALGLRQDGSNFWGRVQGHNVTWGGEHYRVTSVEDISEQHRAMQALRESEERYRLLVDTCPDAIVATDTDTNVIMANGQALRLFGAENLEQLQGIEGGAISFLAAAQYTRARQNIQLTLENDIQRNIEYELVRRDGSKIPVEVSAATLRDDNGRPTGFITVIRDVSERQQAEQERRLMEQQIQHAQKLESLGVLAGGIAHDFNNLLMGVLGNASLALAELKPGSSLQRTVQKIETAALRAAELTNQMLAYSGKGRFLVQPLDLSTIVREMSELLKVSIGKNVTLRLDLAGNLPAVEADASQLRQVVMNLITNASEAVGEEAGLITVYTGIVEADRKYLDSTSFPDQQLGEGRYVVLEVSDTGCGMSPETQARIFEPFFTTKFTGRGLGLAAVLGIVRGHGGTIKIYSEPGRGTTIKVLLPASNRQPQARSSTSQQQPAPEHDLGDRTILVIDDDHSVREVSRAILERAGAQVLTASDGEEGLAVFARESERIDLIILDTTMPRMNGKEAFRRIRQVDASTQVLLTSGYNEQDITSHFAGKGLAGFLQKPYRAQSLLDAVARVLRQQKG